MLSAEYAPTMAGLEAIEVGSRNEVGHPPWVDALAGLEVAVGGGAEPDHQLGKLACDQSPADDLVVDAPPVQVVLVKEVPKGTVADVMEQTRHAHRLLDQSDRGRAGAAGGKRRVEVARPLAGEVHRTQRMLESGMLRRREDPPRALQLVDAPEPLQPGAVDQVLLGRPPGHAPGSALRDAKVSVDGVTG